MLKSYCFATAVLAGLCLSGCASWSSDKPTSTALAQPAAASPATDAVAVANLDPAKLQAVMAEVRRSGDPVDQDQLLEALRQSDQSLWPLVIQQSRAAAAYRRRATDRAGATAQIERLPAVGNVAPTEDGVATAAPTTAAADACYPCTDDVLSASQPSLNRVMQAAYVTPVANVPSKVFGSAPLVVRNIAFCSEVRSYGCTKRFEKYEFETNQEVLLYAELENFVSEPTANGYRTALGSRYRIVDGRGRQVLEHAFAGTEEYCQNPRRDFFISYHVRLPKSVSPGKYALQLSIEDLTSHKSGAASIEFDMKRAKEEG
jgi:hypothetical protein